MYLGDQRQDLDDLRQDLGDQSKDLGDQSKDLGDQSEDRGDQRPDLGDQRKDLNPSQVVMPLIEKQIDWVKPTQLPAGPREKRPIGRLFSSTIILR